MFRVAYQLFRFRGLLATLTSRELKARYRGSVLGFLWSLANPLLLLAVYTFVFSVVFKPDDRGGMTPYALFLVSGLFPWIWTSASALEGSMSLIANSGLIRKAVFPAELLPMVSVLSNLVHFLFALPIVIAALLAGRILGYPVGGLSIVALPAVILLHLPMVAGLALGVAALTVHFKDVRDLLANLLTLLFFLTPILYLARLRSAASSLIWWAVRLNPFTPFILAYQDVLFCGRVPDAPAVGADGPGEPRLLGLRGGALRPPARDAGGGRVIAESREAGERPAVEPRGGDPRRGAHQALPPHPARATGCARSRAPWSAAAWRAACKPEESIAALEAVDFAVHRGEAFGVIGGNGSGKSTLLKLVAGMLKPTTGRITVAGRVAALIELGAGFHPEISGRENVFINGAVLGLTRKQIERRYDEIVEFSGLGDFIEEPVKNYSSGMYVRLGFAVAVHTDPDVLLVDEVLAVGDEAFAHRCLRRIEEFLAAGKTLLLVSHSLDLVEGRLRPRALARQRPPAPGRRAPAGDRRLPPGGGRAGGGGAPGGQAAARAVGRGGLARSCAGDRGRRRSSRSGCSPAARSATTVDHRRGRRLRDPRPGREPLDDFVFGVAISTPRGFEVWGTNTDLEATRRAVSRGRPRCASPARPSASPPASTWWTSPSTPGTARPTTTSAGRSPSR